MLDCVGFLHLHHSGTQRSLSSGVSHILPDSGRDKLNVYRSALYTLVKTYVKAACFHLFVLCLELHPRTSKIVVLSYTSNMAVHAY